MPIKLYNTMTKQFWGKHGWSNVGRTWGRKCDFRQSHLPEDTTGLEVWVYTETGVLKYHVTDYLSMKPAKTTPFRVYFCGLHMSRSNRAYVIHHATSSLPGETILDTTLTFVRIVSVSGGDGAVFKNSVAEELYMSPTQFKRVIPHLILGDITGRFGFVKRGKYISLTYLGD